MELALTERGVDHTFRFFLRTPISNTNRFSFNRLTLTDRDSVDFDETRTISAHPMIVEKSGIFLKRIAAVKQRSSTKSNTLRTRLMFYVLA